MASRDVDNAVDRLANMQLSSGTSSDNRSFEYTLAAPTMKENGETFVTLTKVTPLKNCVDFNCDPAKINHTGIRWDQTHTSFWVKVQAASTEFTPNEGGRQGVRFLILIETYDESDKYKLLHAAVCPVKVYCDKGAERQLKTDEYKMKKKGEMEVLLKQVVPQDASAAKGSSSSFEDIPEGKITVKTETLSYLNKGEGYKITMSMKNLPASQSKYKGKLYSSLSLHFFDQRLEDIRDKLIGQWKKNNSNKNILDLADPGEDNAEPAEINEAVGASHS